MTSRTKHFEFDPIRYRHSSIFQREWGVQLIGSLDLRGDETILDIGCGDGWLTNQLAERVHRGKVVGVDYSKRMIDFASAERRANVELVHSDILDCQFDKFFDIVFSNATFHWINDHELLMRIVSNAIRSNGQLRANFMGSGHAQRFARCVKQIMGSPNFAKSFKSFEWPWVTPTAPKFLAVLAKYGFEGIVDPQASFRHFPSQAAFTAWADEPMLIPFIDCLPESARADFRDAVISELLRECRDADGQLAEHFCRLNVIVHANF